MLPATKSIRNIGSRSTPSAILKRVLGALPGKRLGPSDWSRWTDSAVDRLWILLAFAPCAWGGSISMHQLVAQKRRQLDTRDDRGTQDSSVHRAEAHVVVAPADEEAKVRGNGRGKTPRLHCPALLAIDWERESQDVEPTSHRPARLTVPRSCSLILRARAPTSISGKRILLLLRPCEVLSCVANAPVLEVAHHTLRVLFQHRHMVVRSFA